MSEAHVEHPAGDHGHHAGEQIDLTKEEMLQQAANAGIEGASGMTKAELEKELAAHADS